MDHLPEFPIVIPAKAKIQDFWTPVPAPDSDPGVAGVMGRNTQPHL